MEVGAELSCEYMDEIIIEHTQESPEFHNCRGSWVVYDGIDSFGIWLKTLAVNLISKKFHLSFAKVAFVDVDREIMVEQSLKYLL